jgi:serine/threonine protein kinase
MAKGCHNELTKIIRNDTIDSILVAKYLGDFKQINELQTTNDIFKNHPEMQSLMKQCLCVDPRNRISCQQALKH